MDRQFMSRHIVHPLSLTMRGVNGQRELTLVFGSPTSRLEKDWKKTGLLVRSFDF
jgi:hypothetical protein